MVDTEGIRVQSRENREGTTCGKNIAIEEQQTSNIEVTDREKKTENIVIDMKRKRVDGNVMGENNGRDTEKDMVNQLAGGPKNVLVAGSGVQARQES